MKILLSIAVVVASAVFWIRSAYQHDLASARERVSTGSTLAQTRCGPIEYATQGDGPALLAVHGAGGGFDQGLMLAEKLHGFRVIAPSRFGYLRTPLPQDASAEAQADAYACLLDSLGVQQAAVIGVSAGGPSTMQFCLRHAERCRAMVLLVPLAWSDIPKGEARLSALQQFVLEQTLTSDFVYWTMTHLFREPMIESILGTPQRDFYVASPEEQARTLAMLDLVQHDQPARAGLTQRSEDRTEPAPL